MSRIVLGFVLICAAADPNLSDACNFVMARLYKQTSSICTPTNFCFTSSFDQEPITCARAVELARSIIFNLAASDEHRHKRGRYEFSGAAVLEVLLVSFIVPAAEDVLFRNQPLSDMAIEAMTEVNRVLLIEMRDANQFQWGPAGVWLRVSNAMNRLTQIVQELALSRQHRLWSDDMRAASLGPVANFCFDLASFGGFSCSRASTEVVSIAKSGSIGYREAHEFEKRIVSLPVPPVTPQWITNVSRAITSLKRSATRGRPLGGDQRLLESLIDFLIRAPPAEVDTAWSLLTDQVHADLCSQSSVRLVSDIALSVKWSSVSRSSALRAAGIMLVRCRNLEPAVTQQSSITNASLAVRVLMEAGPVPQNRGPLNIPDQADHWKIAELASSQADVWTRPPNGTVETAQSILKSFVQGTLPWKPLMGPWRFTGPQFTWPSPLDSNGLRKRAQLKNMFEDTMVLLGRLLGLVLRMKGSIPNLGLSEDTIRVLISDGPILHEDRDLVEAAYFVKRGAMDALGILGFRVLSTPTLLARFGL